ncbi:hypothetical protein [Aureibaculum luteum]|uniref:hypothetical protein n=1 Tax=Aureibaculum luteum TaxID=1548456 RepID=UPI000E4AF9B7|nr:hypothetical protein [Aureibaculum luteum]
MQNFFKILILLICFSSLNTTFCYAQDLEDNLKKYQILNDSIAKYEETDFQKALDFSKKQLVLAEGSRDTLKIIEALDNIANYNGHMINLKLASVFFERELKFLRKIDLSDKSMHLLKLLIMS